MTGTREMLEGEAYWGRIRGVKRKLYILEGVLIIVMGAVLIFTSEEFSTSPLLLPFDRLLWFILMMFIVVEVEGFVFRFMQLQYTKSDSVKYIMTTNGMKRAVIVIIIAGIIAVTLLLPGLAHGLEGSLSYHGTATPDHPGRFQNKDPLALSSVTSITIHCNAPANIYLVSQFLLDTYGDLAKGHAINDVVLADPDMEINMTAHGYDTYYLYVSGLNSTDNATTKADYALNTKLSDSVTSLLPIVAIVVVAANAIWIGYLYPCRNKCSKKSIYK
jgi:hypothetical protein